MNSPKEYGRSRIEYRRDPSLRVVKVDSASWLPCASAPDAVLLLYSERLEIGQPREMVYLDGLTMRQEGDRLAEDEMPTLTRDVVAEIALTPRLAKELSTVISLYLQQVEHMESSAREQTR